jgi:hypothetical protein
MTYYANFPRCVVGRGGSNRLFADTRAKGPHMDEGVRGLHTGAGPAIYDRGVRLVCRKSCAEESNAWCSTHRIQAVSCSRRQLGQSVAVLLLGLIG